MKVILNGYGAMGQHIEALLLSKKHEILGVVDPSNKTCLSSLNEIHESADVIIDFSHPASLDLLLVYALKTQTPLVIATTGLGEDQEKQIENASHIIPILYTKNTSLGINVLQKVVYDLSKSLADFDIEIIEKHHNKKIDAPSGTAKLFLEQIESARDIHVLHGRSGISKRDKQDVTVHAVRGGTINGEHTILFAGDDEIIEIKHTALSKKLFANGALKAALFIQNQKPGLFSMQDAL